MPWDNIVIKRLSAPPAEGYAQQVSTQEEQANNEVPTFEGLYLVPGITIYIISITGLNLTIPEQPMQVEPNGDETFEIVVNGTRYLQCKVIGGNAGSSQMAAGKSVLNSTVIYKGFKFDD